MAFDDPTKSPSAADTKQFNKLEADLLQAEALYETVRTLVESAKASDLHTARLIVETADDAIRIFGNTNQDKKVQLRAWKATAEEVLPPATLKELKERAEAQLIARGYPRAPALRKTLLFVLGLGILISVSLGIYKEFWPHSEKPSAAETVAPRKPPDSISLTLPDGRTLRSIIKFLAQRDNYTAEFQPTCTENFLGTEVEGVSLTAASTVELIELLRLHLEDSRYLQTYQVTRKPEKGTYEISCK